MIILIILNIIELFFTLVFLEIIELNFCGLNTNTKRNIIERAINDFNFDLEENEIEDNIMEVKEIN